MSLAGKRARCKKCSNEFIIPAPCEPNGPRSSVAIPIAAVVEPTRSAPLPRTSWAEARTPEPSRPVPPLREPEPARPSPLPRSYRSEPKAPETTRPAPPPRTVRAELKAPEPPLDALIVDDDEDDDAPYALDAPSKPAAPPVRTPRPIPRVSSQVPARPAKKDAPARPPWLIPAIAGGAFAAIVVLNIGLFVVFALLNPGPAEPLARANREDTSGSGGNAGKSPTKPLEAESARPTPAPAKAKPAAPPKNSKKAATVPKKAAPPVEEEAAPDRVMNTAEIVAKYEPSVALIKGKKGSGTGFVARSGIVATNSHVIANERVKDIEVRFPSAEEGKQGPYTAKLLFQDRERDLALLGVTSDLPPVRVADQYKFRKGEDVTVIGNPGVGGQMILENAISRGVVSSMTKINEHVFLQLGIAINPGNSGGPVFDPKGRVIGVVTLKTTQQEGLAFAIPADDLRSALDTAETMLDSQPAEAGPSDGTPAEGAPAVSGDTSASKSNAPRLAYAWKPGQTYVYSFDLTLDAGAGVVSLQGNSIYRVKAVDGDGITLGHRGWYTTTRRGKDGKVPPGGNGGAKTLNEIEIKIEPNGDVVKASGSSPLPLVGDFSMLLIEPLPDEPKRTWDESKSITLNEVEQVPGSGGGVPRLGRPGVNNMPGGGARSRLAQRGRPGGRQPAPQPSQPSVKVTAHEATEETKYTLGELKGDTAPIRKDYELTTREMVGNDPRLKMTGVGTIAFNVKAGIPQSLDYKLNVVENSPNATFRLPITVSCKLLDGKAAELGLRAPVYNPTAMNKIDSGDLGEALAGLRSPDANKRREACRFLYDSAPIENKRGETSRALEKVAKDQDMGVRSDVIKAMGIWGDTKVVDKLIASLADESFGVRDELYEALGRLSPTEKAAEAIIPGLEKEWQRAHNALRAIGQPAEGPLLKYAEEGAMPKVRGDSLRLLREVGTSQSIPALQKMAKWKDAGELGRTADEALKNINNRWPSDDDWAALIKQARSPDGRKRRMAADRFLQSPPVEARRAEVVKALESLVGDVDGGTQSQAIRALGLWGNESSRAVLIERLEDPDLRPYPEAIEALAKFGPDEDSARAMARWMKKDRRRAMEGLSLMGAAAEVAALSALKEVGKDIFARNDLYQLLAKVGTEASRAELQKAATSADPGDSKRALKDLEDRLVAWDDAALAKVLVDMKSGDGGRRSQAVQKLMKLPILASGKEKAARGLDALWDVDDFFLKSGLREAVVRWGDDKSADFLAERLANPDYKQQWEESMRALVALRPDARTGELLVARYTLNPGFINEVAQKMPAMVDRPMVEVAKKEGELRWRIEACRSLWAFGTPAVVPDLQILAQRAGDAEIAREAEESLKAIAARQ